MPQRSQLYRIGGIRLRLEAEGPWPFTPKRSFGKFRAAGGGAALRFLFKEIRAAALGPAGRRRRPTPPLAVGSRSGLESPLLAVPAVRARLLACCRHPQMTALEINPDAVTILDFAGSRADIFHLPGRDAPAEETGMGPGLLAAFLPRRSGFMLHAAAWEAGDRAALFLAPDAGGKTTAAKLAAGPAATASIIGDDQVAVRRRQSGFFVYGTPWGLIGRQAPPVRAGGLFLLEKADHFSLAAMRPREMLAYIWQEHQDYNRLLPRELKTKAFDLLRCLCRSVPCFRLSFSLRDFDAPAVASALAD